MKKILLFILLVLITGCSEEELNDFHNNLSETLENAYKKPEYIDTNPIKVGLYRKGKLVHEYHTKFQDRKDLITVSIIYSNDEILSSTRTKENWKKYFNKYEDINDYKIGFHIEFETQEKKLENTVLGPSNMYKLDPYLYAYLYDDIHSTGYYSHLETKDIKDNTIFSSIKLYMHLKSKDVISPITLTVFTYKNENDFLDGKYRGNSQYTMKIYND